MSQLGAVTGRHAFDTERLPAHLERHLPEFRGPLEVQQFQGGQSNPTYLLTTSTAKYVLRSKPGPAAKLLPSAHAIEREFHVMRALAAQGIPVPWTLLLVDRRERDRPRVLPDAARRRPHLLGPHAARAVQRRASRRSTTK